jgi:hypothetical protein
MESKAVHCCRVSKETSYICNNILKLNQVQDLNEINAILQKAEWGIQIGYQLQIYSLCSFTYSFPLKQKLINCINENYAAWKDTMRIFV